ncbi:MAG: DUF177 domain-containing protein [Bacteroidales bacterium]|nr:DUF177 domain-containing protein [Bacteroidales bacterium]
MDYFKQFVIPFKGLSIGIHQFRFDINNKFFESIEYSEIKKGKIDIELLFEKQENMLILNFSINGYVNVNCDRCLEDFEYPVSGKEQLIVKFGNKRYEENNEILIIPESEHQIEISHLIYEYISLLLPIKRIHPNDDNGISRCKGEVIRKIEELSNKKNNIDPRWDVLKKLNTKN